MLGMVKHDEWFPFTFISSNRGPLTGQLEHLCIGLQFELAGNYWLQLSTWLRCSPGHKRHGCNPHLKPISPAKITDG